MATWLYQMSSNTKDPWSPSVYRREVWEGVPTTWPIGKVQYRDEPEISRGDTVILFFPKTNNPEPGIYGWGVILEVVLSKDRSRLKFQACPPSDYLKIAVLWDGELMRLVDKIRGKMTQSTMWAIKKDEYEVFKKKIALK